MPDTPATAEIRFWLAKISISLMVSINIAQLMKFPSGPEVLL